RGGGGGGAHIGGGGGGFARIGGGGGGFARIGGGGGGVAVRSFSGVSGVGIGGSRFVGRSFNPSVRSSIAHTGAGNRFIAASSHTVGATGTHLNNLHPGNLRTGVQIVQV